MSEPSPQKQFSCLFRDNSSAGKLDPYDGADLPEDGSTGLSEFISNNVANLKKPLSTFAGEDVFLFPRSLSDMQDIEGKQSILQYGMPSETDASAESKRPGLRTTNIAGILNFRDRANGLGMSLSITSRFFNVGETGSLADDWLLAYMMDKVLNFNILKLDFSADPDGAWRRLLMLMFPVYLKRAMSKGMYRQYVRREHNDSRPRGTIDIARHIASNIPFRGTIAYTTREYDMDNPVTQLIRHTIEFIGTDARFGRQVFRPDDKDTRRYVRDIELATDAHYSPGDRARVVYENQTHMVRHPFYSEYRDLQRLCLMILTRRGVNPNDASGKVHGILFDCAWLWEEYLNLLLQRCYAPEEYAVRHPRNKDRNRSTNGAQYFFEGNIGLIYPDFLLFPQAEGIKADGEETHTVVADAKYKPEGNVNGDDYKQVLSYMYRFDSCLGLYLHPVGQDGRKDGLEPEVLRLDVKERKGCSVVKLGLPVVKGPCETYQDYCRTMAEREEEFLGLIRGNISGSIGEANTGK